MFIEITRYANGEPLFRPVVNGLVTVEKALGDMFRRLLAGSVMTTSGFNYGLISHAGETGYDEALYGGAPAKLQDFLIRASAYGSWDGKLELGTSAHEALLRSQLIKDLGLEFSNAELKAALALRQDQFLAAMAMRIETGEDIAVLFR